MNARRKTVKKKWSKHVTETSNAMDLEKDVFKKEDPKEIAQSLRHSVNKSYRRKGTPFQSAMSMLNFYINRGGKNVSKEQLNVLEKAKNELRILFGRETK